MGADNRAQTEQRLQYCAAAILALIFSAHAFNAKAADIFWNGGFNDSWQQVFNWDPVVAGRFVIRRTPAEFDNVIMNTPTDDFVYLYADTEPVDGLELSNDVNLYTNGHKLTVDDGGAGMVSIAGADTLLSVEKITGDPSAVSFDADNVRISGGRMAVVAGMKIDGTLDIRGTGLVSTAAGATVTVDRLLMAPSLFSSGELTLFGITTFNSIGAAGNSIGSSGSSVFNVTGSSSAEFAGALTIGGLVGDPVVNVNTNGRLYTRDLTIRGSGSAADVSVNVNGAGSRIEQRDGGSLTVGGSTGSAILRVSGNGYVNSSTGPITIGDTGWIALFNLGGSAGTFRAFGDVLVDGGRLSGSGGSFFWLAQGRDMTVQNGGRVELDNYINLGTLSELVVDDSTFSIDPDSGSKALSVGNEFDDVTVTVRGPTTTFDLDGVVEIGERSGSGEVTISNGADAYFRFLDMGTQNWLRTHGTLNVESGASVAMFGNADILGTGQDSTAIVKIDGTGTIFAMGGNASFFIGSNGAFGHAETHVQNGARLVLNTGSGTIGVRKRGELHVTNALVTSAGSGGFVNQGLVNLGAFGTINLTNGGSFINTDGTVTGTGVIDVNGQTFDNSGGTLSPGSSAGLLTLRDATFVADDDSVLQIELGGLARGQYDELFIGGNATLDGTLEIIFIDGFKPELGDTFEFITALTVAGAFDAIVCGDCAGREFDVVFGSSTMQLSVSAVPVPATVWLLVSALGGLLARGRK